MPIRPELRHFYSTPEWQAARAACRERAGDHCEKCGRSNGSYALRRLADKNGGAVIILVQCGAAHLNNVAGDDRPENLAWLCRGCHLRFDRYFHHVTRATRKDAARPLLQGAGL